MKIIEALESLNAISDFTPSSDLGTAAEVIVHGPNRDRLEKFYQLFGYRRHALVQGQEPFFRVEINDYLRIFTSFEPPPNCKTPTESVNDPYSSFCLAHSFFYGQTEFALDAGFDYQVRVYSATAEEAVHLCSKHSSKPIPREYSGSKWLAIGETFIIHLRG